jgi:hypothetical protein
METIRETASHRAFETARLRKTLSAARLSVPSTRTVVAFDFTFCSFFCEELQ